MINQYILSNNKPIITFGDMVITISEILQRRILRSSTSFYTAGNHFKMECHTILCSEHTYMKIMISTVYKLERE